MQDSIFSILTWARHKLWLKLCSLAVAVSFILPITSWAFDPGSYSMVQQPFMIHHLGQAVNIPKKFASVERAFQGRDKTVICIQDLHCNYEVQKNIAAIIDYLVKQQGVKLVAVEGASGPVDPGLLRNFPIKSVRDMVSDYLVRQGQLTGADFYAVTAQAPVILEGIETQALYDESLKTVRSFLTAQTQGLIYDLRDSLDELKPSVYSPPLVKLDNIKQQYREGRIDLLQYASKLANVGAKKLSPLQMTYPQLSRFLSLNQPSFEPGINQEKLHLELDDLDGKIRESLYTHDRQRQLDEQYRRLDIVEKLLNISATQEELADFRNHRDNYKVQSFLDFINNVGSNTPNVGNSRHYSPLQDYDLFTLDQSLNQVARFYQLADERSHHFVDNLLKSMDQHEQNIAVIINGGFHADKVTEELQKRNISYLSVRPQVTRLDVVNPYFQLLQNRRTPLEKLLAKNQTILAVANQMQAMAGNATKRIKLGFQLLSAASVRKVMKKLNPELINEYNIKKWEIIAARNTLPGTRLIRAELNDGREMYLLAADRSLQAYGLSKKAELATYKIGYSHFLVVFDSLKHYEDVRATLREPISVGSNLFASIWETVVIGYYVIVYSLISKERAENNIDRFVSGHEHLTGDQKHELKLKMMRWMEIGAVVLYLSIAAAFILVFLDAPFTVPHTNIEAVVNFMANPIVIAFLPTFSTLLLMHVWDSLLNRERAGNFFGGELVNGIKKMLGRDKKVVPVEEHVKQQNDKILPISMKDTAFGFKGFNKSVLEYLLVKASRQFDPTARLGVEDIKILPQGDINWEFTNDIMAAKEKFEIFFELSRYSFEQKKIEIQTPLTTIWSWLKNEIKPIWSNNDLKWWQKIQLIIKALAGWYIKNFIFISPVYKFNETFQDQLARQSSAIWSNLTQGWKRILFQIITIGLLVILPVNTEIALVMFMASVLLRDALQRNLSTFSDNLKKMLKIMVNPIVSLWNGAGVVIGKNRSALIKSFLPISTQWNHMNRRWTVLFSWLMLGGLYFFSAISPGLLLLMIITSAVANIRSINLLITGAVEAVQRILKQLLTNPNHKVPNRRQARTAAQRGNVKSVSDFGLSFDQQQAIASQLIPWLANIIKSKKPLSTTEFMTGIRQVLLNEPSLIKPGDHNDVSAAFLQRSPFILSVREFLTAVLKLLDKSKNSPTAIKAQRIQYMVNNLPANRSPRLTSLKLKSFVHQYISPWLLKTMTDEVKKEEVEWLIAEQLENIIIGSIMVGGSWLGVLMGLSLGWAAIVSAVILIIYMLWTHQRVWDFAMNNGRGGSRKLNLKDWPEIIAYTTLFFTVFTTAMLVTGQLLDAGMVMQLASGLLALVGSHRLVNWIKAVRKQGLRLTGGEIISANEFGFNSGTIGAILNAWFIENENVHNKWVGEIKGNKIHLTNPPYVAFVHAITFGLLSQGWEKTIAEVLESITVGAMLALGFLPVAIAVMLSAAPVIILAALAVSLVLVYMIAIYAVVPLFKHLHQTMFAKGQENPVTATSADLQDVVEQFMIMSAIAAVALLLVGTPFLFFMDPTSWVPYSLPSVIAAVVVQIYHAARNAQRPAVQIVTEEYRRVAALVQAGTFVENNTPIARHRQGPQSVTGLMVARTWNGLLRLILIPMIWLLPGKKSGIISRDAIKFFTLSEFYYASEITTNDRYEGYLNNLAEVAKKGIILTSEEESAITEVMELKDSASWQAKLLAGYAGLTIYAHRMKRDTQIRQEARPRKTIKELLDTIPSQAKPGYMVDAINTVEVRQYMVQLNYGPQDQTSKDKIIVSLTRAVLTVISHQAPDEQQSGMEFFSAFFEELGVKTDAVATRRGDGTGAGLNKEFLCPTAFLNQPLNAGSRGTLFKLLRAVGEGQIWLIKDGVEEQRQVPIKRNLLDVNA